MASQNIILLTTYERLVLWYNRELSSDYTYIVFCLSALLLNFLVNSLVSRFNDERRKQFTFVKSVIWGIAIPAIGIWMWFSLYDNPFNEYRIITNSSTVNGFINKVEQESDVVEYNGGRSADITYCYYYQFSFNLPDGRSIQGVGKQNGEIPEYLLDIENKPSRVTVEYLSDNPEINRVRGMSGGNKTIYDLFKSTFLIGILVLLLCFYIGFTIIDSGLKDYRTGTQKIKEHNYNKKY